MQWMIYGANGYTGGLIAREAVARGLNPILAGRNADKLAPLAAELGLAYRAFGLEEVNAASKQLADVDGVIHCAGPFSETAAAMMEACLSARTHYLDITGEIAVFEHAQMLSARAEEVGVVLCPGVGFDVIPTDCVAASLAQALPDASHLALGFDSRSGFSPGTAKTSVEGLAMGGRVRRDGDIVAVPLAWRTRKIDFGDGEKLAMTIPWGDVSTAFHTTGIPNIEVYIPASPRLVKQARKINYLRWLLRFAVVQGMLKRRIERTVRGPDAAARERMPTFVWGEVRNAAGTRKVARLRTANGYSLTVTGALAVAAFVDAEQPAGGAYTPARLAGAALAEALPGSGRIEISDE